MPQKKVEVQFPFGGISSDLAEDYQAPGTTRQALNVRGIDHVTGRRRGSSRSGTKIFNHRILSDTPSNIYAPDGIPQALASVAYDTPRIKFTQLNNNSQTHEDGTLVDPPTVQEGEVWRAGESFTTGAYSVVVDIHGNVYTLTAERNVEKYNADGELLHTIPASGSTANEDAQRLSVDAMENIYVLTTNGITGRSTLFRFEPDEDLGYTQRFRVAVTGICRDMVIVGTLMYGVFNDSQVQSSESELRCYGNLDGESPIMLWSKRAPNPANGLHVNSRGDIYVTSPANVLRGTGDQAFLDADISWIPHEVGEAPDYIGNAEQRVNCWLDAYEIEIANGSEIVEWNDSKQLLTTETTSSSPFDPIHDTTNRKLIGMSTGLSETDSDENRYSPMYKANGFAANKPGIVFDGDRTSQKADGSTWTTGEALVSQFNSDRINRSTSRDTATSQLCPVPARDDLGTDANTGVEATGTPWALYFVVKVDSDGEARCLFSSSSASRGGDSSGGQLGFDVKIIVNRTVSGLTESEMSVTSTPGTIQLLIGEQSCNNALIANGVSPPHAGGLTNNGFGVDGDRWFVSDPSFPNEDGVAVITLVWSGGINSITPSGEFSANKGLFRVNGRSLGLWSTDFAYNGPIGSDIRSSSSFILGAPCENAFKPVFAGLNSIYGGTSDLGEVNSPTDIGLKGFKGTVSEVFSILSSSPGTGSTTGSPNSLPMDAPWDSFGEETNNVETATEVEKIEAYLAYKWGMQEHLAADHPFQPDNVGGETGQPPETNTDLYDVAGVSAEDWVAYLEAHFDISDTDKAFGNATPILAKYSAHNGELKWAFNASGVGLGVTSSDDGDVYTIGEPVDPTSDSSNNPTTGNPEPDATARHTVDLGDNFTCEAVGTKTPWILNSTEYPVQNHEYPKPIVDQDGDVYLPSDPKIATSSEGDETSQEAGVFKVKGNLDEGETDTGQGQVQYVLGTPVNLFVPFSSGGGSDESACRDFDRWSVTDYGPGTHAIPGQMGTAIYFPEAVEAPNGKMEAKGGTTGGEPCLNLVHTDQRERASTTNETTTTSTDFTTLFTGAAPKYANLMFNHPDPQRQLIEHVEQFRVNSDGLLGGNYSTTSWQGGTVTRTMLTERVDPATGMENSPSPSGIYNATRVSTVGTGSDNAIIYADVNHTVEGATQLVNGKLYCFSVFVKVDNTVAHNTIVILMYPTGSGGSTVCQSRLNVTFSSDPNTPPTTDSSHVGSFEQATFTRQIGTTGWYRLGVVLKYDSSLGDAPGNLRCDIRLNGNTGFGHENMPYGWFLWGPMLNQCPTAYPATDVDPAVTFSIAHAWSSTSHGYVGSSAHNWSSTTYPNVEYGEDNYDGRYVEGDARKVCYIPTSPYGQAVGDGAYNVEHEGVVNPNGIDLRTGDEIFTSWYVRKVRREDTPWPENNVEDGGWFVSNRPDAVQNIEAIAVYTSYHYCRKWAGSGDIDYITGTPQIGSFSLNLITGAVYSSATVFAAWDGEDGADTTAGRVSDNSLASAVVEDAGDYWRVGLWEKMGVDVDGGRGPGDVHYAFIKPSPWLNAIDDTEFYSIIGDPLDVDNRCPQFQAAWEVYYWGWSLHLNSGVSPQNDGGLTFPSSGFVDPGEHGTLSVARPPEEPDYYGYEIKGPEFLYHTTDTAGTGTSGSYLVKSRVVAAEDLLGEDESARKQQILMVSGGKLHRVYKDGEESDDGKSGIVEISWDDQMSTVQSNVQWTQHFGKTYFADGDKYWIYDPLFEDIEELKSKKEGTVPPRGRLITSWRGRLVIARTTEDPYNWYMSAIGEADNWNFFPPLPTAIQATSGSASRAGKAPDIINTLISYSDDLLLIGGDKTIARMTGDPMSGGQIDIVSRSVGMMYGDSWAMDPEGMIYFVSSEAIVYAMSPNGQMQRISNSLIEKDYLRHLDDSMFRVRVVWNHKDEGLQIFFVPNHMLWSTSDDQLSMVSLFWERKNNAWWPDKYHYTRAPYAALSVNGDGPNDRALLLAAMFFPSNEHYPGRRAQVMSWGEDPGDDLVETDTGVEFDSEVFMDVINENVRDGNEQFRAISLEAEMVYPTSTAIPPIARLHVSNESDNLHSSANGYRNIDLPDGRSGRHRLRGSFVTDGWPSTQVEKGTNMGIHLRGIGAARFCMESMHLTVAPTGRRRG